MRLLQFSLVAILVLNSSLAMALPELKRPPVKSMTCKALGRESIINAQDCKGPEELLDKKICGKRDESVLAEFQRRNCPYK